VKNSLGKSLGTMSKELLSRVARPSFHSKVMQVGDTLKFFRDGQTLGMSGFTPAGYPKAIAVMLGEHVEQNNLQGKMRFRVLAGASTGAETLDNWARLDMLSDLYPYQTGKNIAKRINAGELNFKDVHLSNYPNFLSYGYYGDIDIAIIEATEILPDGSIVPGAASGIAQEVAHHAKQILIEVNTSMPSFKGLHDVVYDQNPPHRRPLMISRVDDRCGEPTVRLDPGKVIGIVESQLPDQGRTLPPPRQDELKIAEHITEFMESLVKRGTLPPNLLPLQSGVGGIANAVMVGFSKSKFQDLELYTEVAQDNVLDLCDAGKLKFCSTAALSLSTGGFQRFYNEFDKYREKFVIRPQAITNHPELIRRLGVISMNTPVEIDMYGHANSTHALGSKLLNGIGGSGDFFRNGFLSIVHTPSTRPSKSDPTGISCVVPFASHVDHTEHDILIYVTEQGLADTRGLDPRKRARLIIEKCGHPDYKEQLLDYLQIAEKRHLASGSGHQPHLLEVAFQMHVNLQKHGTMKLKSWDVSA